MSSDTHKRRSDPRRRGNGKILSSRKTLFSVCPRAGGGTRVWEYIAPRATYSVPAQAGEREYVAPYDDITVAPIRRLYSRIHSSEHAPSSVLW